MSAQTITFQAHSLNPAEVVRVYRHDSAANNSLPPDSVLLRFLAAPINPQDLMVIAGRYPVQPHYKHVGEPIPGYDGVARVERIGEGVSTLQVGDHVIPRAHGLGTWRSEAVVPASSLLKISNKIEPSTACLLKTSCSVAYLLVESAKNLHPGDFVAINAASGSIARMAVQFARLRGCPSICIIRDREDVESVRQSLLSQGAHVVLTESEFEKGGVAAACVEGKRVMLALDSVFGTSGQHLAALLSTGGTFINYGSLGGASGQIALTQELLFWKQITFRNFRLSQALSAYPEQAQVQLLNWFVELFEQGQLVAPPVHTVEWNNGEGLEEKIRETFLKQGALVGYPKPVLQFESV
ncbi:hypothetical protein POX_d05781 [Penicillium oxalicum]|uniref:enoyl-[acyl-carrier-protein] reductase n=1 Tax=Penicillium oxalicum (strain 114-2 / CGMCC 5302) TaxID=933388 RepID=S7ZNT9_PENO1|nr:hypothetical protein POX_d05781 [Penicillium oxalicum]EPS32044.1 hypothetical protein PDE_07003 [Penicillium oxalicum 114-2]KAI2790272.1 hypothetical protein POX_d05781 [Penicillium oxalicum]